jgi:hypothetical protein
MNFPRHRAATAFFGLATIWLLTHRYHGILHDGFFYAVQALAHSAPERFGSDLFFAFGSQNDYTLFTPVYAWLASRIGLGHAAFSLLVTAHLVWAIAAVQIARHWLRGAFLVAGVALVFALPRIYGSYEIFSYAESFLTARIWAESLVLTGIAANLSGRPWRSAITMGIAFLMHPIIALPGVLYLAALHSRRYWKWLPVVAVLGAVIAFALPSMDATWLEMVRRRAPYVLLDQWQWSELTEPFTWIGILIAAARGVPASRNTFLALALMGLMGIALAATGTVTKAALLIQAQPWRCLWLLKVSGVLALVLLVMHRWQNSAADRWLLAGFIAAALTANSLGGPVALLLALLADALWRRPAPPELPRWLGPAASIALFAIALETLLAMLQQIVAALLRVRDALTPNTGLPLGDLAAIFDSPLALLLPVFAVLLMRATNHRPAAALAVAALCFVTALHGWYRADDPIQHQLFDTVRARPFDREIPHNATVYWEGHFLYAWLLLGQGNYASIQQSVGVVFSPQAANEARRRLARLATFGSIDSDVGTNGALVATKQRQAPRAPQQADLVELCRDPVLHSVILKQAIGQTSHPQWIDSLTHATWYLHRCSDFRV